jgi:hypothetical protein
MRDRCRRNADVINVEEIMSRRSGIRRIEPAP